MEIVKGNPHCYNKLTLDCWELSLAFDSFDNKWKKFLFSVQKKKRLFSPLNFPRAAILNFITMEFPLTWELHGNAIFTFDFANKICLGCYV